MKTRSIIVGAVAIALSVFWNAVAALAFCGTVQASAVADNREDAIQKANRIGLRETSRLDSNYGGKVHYSPARVNCQESHVQAQCKITQKFCVDGAQSRTSRGEEGSRGHRGCPRGTRPVPETDNCVPVAEHNENNPGCKSWKRSCRYGDNRACGKYESNCQND